MNLLVSISDSALYKSLISPIETFACLEMCGTHMPWNSIWFVCSFKYLPKTTSPSSGRPSGAKLDSSRMQARACASEDTSNAHVLYAWQTRRRRLVGWDVVLRCLVSTCNQLHSAKWRTWSWNLSGNPHSKAWPLIPINTIQTLKEINHECWYFSLS